MNNKEFSEDLKEMINMQVKLNQLLAGKDWRTKDWQTALISECAELVDHLGFKWWNEKESIDQDQVFIELADIWFFTLSFISLSYNINYEYKNPFIEDEYEDYILVNNYFENVKDLIFYVLQNKVYHQNNKEKDLFNLSDKNNIDYIITCYLELCESLNLTFNDIKPYYYGKYELNILRKEKGYKQNKYEKYWNGQEDNLIMVQAIKQGMAYDQIGVFLREQYQELVEKTNVKEKREI